MLRKVLVGLVALIVLGAVIGSLGDSKKSDRDADSASGSAVDVAQTAPSEPESNIKLVAKKSFCIATGIDDAYTGDGHVEFFFTFRNVGDVGGTVSVIPVRHYDDGGINMSAMDEVEADVPAGATRRFHTPKFKYKAHEHEVESCGAIVDGGDEVVIEGVAP
jgi:hypothetical protein